MTIRAYLLAAAFAALALSQPAMAGGISGTGLPTPVINGDCVIGSGGVAIWGSCAGGSTGFPIVVGSTSIASGSTTTTLAGLTLTTPTINGAALSGTLSGTAAFSGTINMTGTFEVGGAALGTAAFVATGTSGATIPLLSTANTWGADQQFAAGTAALPSVAIGEAATGLYSGGSHITGFANNGVFSGEITANGTWLASISTSGLPGFDNNLITPFFNVANNAVTQTGRNGISASSYSTSATNPGSLYLGFSKSATIGTQTTTVSGDQLGQIKAEGSDGTHFQLSSQVLFSAGNTVSAGVVPGQIDFKTATAAGAMTEAVKIDDAQQMTIPAIATGTGDYVCSTSGLLTQETTACPASDERVKHDLVPLDWPMGDLMGMRTERFTYNAGKGPPGRRIGVIAQDWQKDFPELVSHDPDGTLHFDYNGSVAVLLAALQQQQWEIVALVGWNVLLTGGFFILWRRRA